MTIDREEHRAFLLEVLEKLSIPAAHVDLFVEVREALKAAAVGCPCNSAPEDAAG